jgi:hypothetical protein
MKKREQTITYPAQLALQKGSLSATGKNGRMCMAGRNIGPVPFRIF